MQPGTNLSMSEISNRLVSQPTADAVLSVAGELWRQANSEGDDTTNRSSSILAATAKVFTEAPEEDLFSDVENAENERCAALLSHIGFVVIGLGHPRGVGSAALPESPPYFEQYGAAVPSYSQTHKNLGLHIANRRAKLPAELLRGLLKSLPHLTVSAAASVFAPFRNFRLDVLQNDTINDATLNQLRVNRALSPILLGSSMQYELQRSREPNHDSAGDFERDSALSALLSVTTIVPSTELFSGPGNRGRPGPAGSRGLEQSRSPSPVSEYFTHLPNFPKPARGLLMEHISLLRLRLRVVQELTFNLVERTLKSKDDRESALGWLSRGLVLIQGMHGKCITIHLS